MMSGGCLLPDYVNNYFTILAYIFTSVRAWLQQITSGWAFPRTNNANIERASMWSGGMGSNLYWMLHPLHIWTLGYIYKALAWLEIPKVIKRLKSLTYFSYGDVVSSVLTIWHVHLYQLRLGIHGICCLNDMPFWILIPYGIIILVLHCDHCRTLV